MQCVPLNFDNSALIGPAERFNPALGRHGGETFLVYRTGMEYEGRLFAGRLDSAFCPLPGSFQELRIGRTPYRSFEDPRLFLHRGQLHLYVTGYRHHFFAAGPMIGTFDPSLGLGTIRMPTYPNRQAREKNWVFFDYAGQLFATYWMAGGRHHVVGIVGERAEPRYETRYASGWKWGEQRGGTNLVEHAGLLWAFFHSQVMSGETTKYYMGGYAMEPRPPFRIVRMSRAPLLTSNETEMIGERYGRRYPKQVVFPTGLVFDGGEWIIAAGYNDRRILLLRLSHAEQEETLADVSVASVQGRSPPAAMARPIAGRPPSRGRIRRRIRRSGIRAEHGGA